MMMKAFFNACFPHRNCSPLLCGMGGILSMSPSNQRGAPWYRVTASHSGWIMELLRSTRFVSPVGPLFLAASGRGLVALEFDARLPGQQTIRPNPRDLREESKHAQFSESLSEMHNYTRELEEYFAGSRREFSFPLDLRGTD